MKKTIKKLFFGASAVALVAMALAPITACFGSDSAYAAETATSNFSVNISSTLSIEVTSEPTALSVGAGRTETGTFKARVTSNKGYSIQMSAEQTALKINGQGDGIPAKADFSGTNSGWAIQDQTDSNKYKAIDETNQTYFTSPTAQTAGLETTFTWGVGVGYDIPDGVYSTEVKLTATTAGN